MMHRFLSSLLVVLALFLSPIAMASGAMAAGRHADPHEMMAMPGHCSGGELPASDSDIPDQASCAAACAALPAIAAPRSLAIARFGAPIIAGPDQPLTAFKREGETPPPRTNPVI